MHVVDPYFDENIGELRNLLNATSSEELKLREPQIVFANEIELRSKDIPRTNDLKELKLIHKQLFNGVYDWAGEIRVVDIKRNDPGAEYFLIVSKINDASHFVFGELSNEFYLCNLKVDTFVDKLSYFYDQLNFVHPFREGNGRTQRIFWSRVAKDAGYEIRWDLIIGDENDVASKVAAEKMDLTMLKSMFSRIVQPLD